MTVWKKGRVLCVLGAGVLLSAFAHTSPTIPATPEPPSAISGSDDAPSDSSAPRNTLPKITLYSKIGNGGVMPQKGVSGTEFLFGFDYDDADNDPCVRCEVWVDLDQSGVYEDHEKFPMIDRTPEGTPFISYHHMERSIVLENVSPDAVIHFRYYVSDGVDEAIDYLGFLTGKTVQVIPITFPVETADGVVQTVAGAHFTIDVRVLMHFSIASSINLEWSALTHANVLGGDDFRVENISVISTGYYNDMYDYVDARVILSTSALSEDGVYTLSFPPLPFQYLHSDDEEKPRKSETGLSPVSVEVMPYVFRPPELSRSGVAIGDPIAYTFSVLVGAPFIDDADLSIEVARMSLLPFEAKAQPTRILRYPGGALLREYSLILRYFGVPNTIETPRLLVGPFEFPTRTVTVFSVNPPPNAPVGFEEYLEAIRDLKERAEVIPLSRRIGGAQLPWQYYLVAAAFLSAACFVWYGSVGIRAALRAKRSRRREHIIGDAYWKLSIARSRNHDDPSMAQMQRYVHALREYVLAIAGAADIPGFPAEKLINAGEAVSRRYREWLAEKAGHVDEDRLADLKRIGGHADLSTRVQADLLDELRSAEKRYFREGGGDDNI